jgi:hypothetical protein
MEIIKESYLKDYARCPYSLHLKLHGINQPMLGTIAMSMYFSIQKRRLLEIKDHNIGLIFPRQIHAGESLMTASEMSPEELSQYLAFKTAESFGNYLNGFWLTNNQNYANQETLWLFESQPFQTANTIKQAGTNYFNFLSTHGAPVLGFIDKEIVFEHRGQKYLVKIPSIYKRIGIIDTSLWNFNQDIDSEISSGLDKSALVTLRLLGLSTLLQQQFFRLKFDLTDSFESLRYQHFNCSKGILSETTRTQQDTDSMQKAIDTFINKFERNEFPPNPKHCSSCPYNSLDDLFEPVCRKRNPNGRYPIPKEFFKKRNWRIEKEEEIVRAFIQNHEIAKLEGNQFQTLFPQLDLEKRMRKLIACASSTNP